MWSLQALWTLLLRKHVSTTRRKALIFKLRGRSPIDTKSHENWAKRAFGYIKIASYLTKIWMEPQLQTSDDFMNFQLTRGKPSKTNDIE